MKIKHIITLFIISIIFSCPTKCYAEENNMSLVVGEDIEVTIDEDDYVDIEETPNFYIFKAFSTSQNWNSYSGGQYCLENMSDREKEFYNELKKNADILLTTTVNCTRKYQRNTYGKINYSGLSLDTAKNIYMLFIFNNPQYWFFDGSVLYDEKYIVPALYSDLCEYGTERLAITDLLSKELDKIETELDYEIATCDCDLEKEHLIHDFICKRIIYDLNEEWNQSVYSAIRPYSDGTVHTVCAGYAKFYTMLANHYNIPSVSDMFSCDDNGHAWNRTKINGTWYCIDCTWDDTTNSWNYKWFNKSQSVFENTYGHESNVYDKYLPKCTVNTTFSPKKTSTTTKTCSEYATQRYACTCGNIYSKITDLTFAEHEEADEWIITPSTCTKIGLKELKCKNCGITIKTEEIPVIDHISDNGTITKTSTCEEYGEKTYKCTECHNIIKVETIAKIECVSDNGTTTEPTCQNDGKIEYKCEFCGRVMKTETIPKTEHIYDNGTIIIQPTHNTTGLLEYKCVNCDNTKTQVIPTTIEHTLGEPIITKEPTCQEVGEKTYYCTECGEIVQTEEIPKIAHISKTTTVFEPTCQKEGKSVSTCTMCNIVLKESTIPKLEHCSDNGTIIKTATCEETGIKEFHCRLCNIVLGTEQIPKAEHKTITNIKQATCVTNGEIEQKCVNCDKIIKTEIIPHTNIHIYANGQITAEPTCVSNGCKTYYCINCDATYTEPIAKLNHILTHYDYKNSTCIEKGHIEYYECTSCGTLFNKANKEIELKDTIIDLSGHSYNLVCAKTPTCTTDGNYEYYVCPICNEVFNRVNDNFYKTTLDKVIKPAKSHNLQLISEKPSKIGISGNIQYYKCSNCNECFLDKNATQSILESNTIIEPLPKIKINTCSISNIKTTYAWTGVAIKPTVIIKNGTKTIKLGTDYSVSYKNNKNAGTATITITGKGDYIGTKTTTFKIVKPVLKYRAYIQKNAWDKNWTTTTIGTTKNTTILAGTKSKLRLQAVQMKLSGIDGSVKYRLCRNNKWTAYGSTTDANVIGSKTDKNISDAIQIKLTGQISTLYDIYYRTYCNKTGWSGWAKNGAKCGSKGNMIEGLQVQLVPKGTTFT